MNDIWKQFFTHIDDEKNIILKRNPEDVYAEQKERKLKRKQLSKMIRKSYAIEKESDTE